MDEVVKLNEDHISRLILAFVHIAADMYHARRQQEQQQEHQQLQKNVSSDAPKAIPQLYRNMTLTAMPPTQPLINFPAGQTSNVAKGQVSYTVAEVLPSTQLPAVTSFSSSSHVLPATSYLSSGAAHASTPLPAPP
uniref:Uncharacterized protein n=1 Tax=Lygus hesperus TaxID=30085 RepID=A0A0A9WTE7_LYGHE